VRTVVSVIRVNSVELLAKRNNTRATEIGTLDCVDIFGCVTRVTKITPGSPIRIMSYAQGTLNKQCKLILFYFE
jgi:hypothetical protein